MRKLANRMQFGVPEESSLGGCYSLALVSVGSNFGLRLLVLRLDVVYFCVELDINVC